MLDQNRADRMLFADRVNLGEQMLHQIRLQSDRRLLQQNAARRAEDREAESQHLLLPTAHLAGEAGAAC